MLHEVGVDEVRQHFRAILIQHLFVEAGDKVSALAHDFGISFIGSMKGIGTTVAGRSPFGQ
jgi:hypothetical protein